jgi:hypothetical protein
VNQFLRGRPSQWDALSTTLLSGLLLRLHLSAPSDLAAAAVQEARVLGVDELVIYLLDYEETHLVPVPSPYADDRGPLGIEGTLGGRAFSTDTILHVESSDPVRPTLWVPLVDGTHRMGVVELVFYRGFGELPDELVTLCERYVHLLAQAVVTKGQYGDVFEYVRRRRRMSVAGELLWKLLPPLTFATDRLVVTGFLEPTYDVGGDSFDYALNGHVFHVAILDAMGHGLSAAGLAAFALSAYRQARRDRRDLLECAHAVDRAVAEQFGGEQFATALLAELDLDDGRLEWVSAGHPAPLLLRDGRLVKQLEAPPAPPLGLIGDLPVTVARESLEPGDRVLLFTDGLPEARLPDGEFLTIERLADFIERQGVGHPPPETLRRLRRAIMEYQGGQLQDDATALLVEWQRGSERALVPTEPGGSVESPSD